MKTLKIVVSSLAIGALCHALPAADVISLNFGSDNGAVGNTTAYGIVSATNWFNLAAVGNTRTDITSMNGLSLGKLVWNCKTIWQYTDGITDNALKGYLDDGGDGVSIALTGIPFEYYRVIVYQATDTPNAQFNPPSLNGVFYSYDGGKKSTVRNNTFLKYGSSRNATAVVGTNVAAYQRVFSGDMTILGGGSINNNGVRGCIAAVQIVEADSYTATLTGDSDFDNLTWSPEKPADGFAAGSVLKVNYAGDTPVTLTANGIYSGLGLAISGPIALKTTTGIKTACVSFDNGASLDLSAMAIDETAKAAVRGVPAATDFILGELDAASVSATLPTVADGYNVALDTVAGFGTRLVVTAPNSAEFRSVNFNFSRTFDNAELTDGARYGLYQVAKENWKVVATNGEGKVVATVSNGVTLTPTITNLALDPSDMGVGLFDGAVNDNPNNNESTATYRFTLSGINEAVGEKYRVIVNMISNDGAGFSPVKIGDKKYHGVGADAGVTMSSDDEVRWGTLSANSTATEGLNTVVSDVLTADSVTVETCRNHNQYGARASICALQVVKVGELAQFEAVAFTANLTGDATWGAKTGLSDPSAEWKNGADNTITLTNTASAAEITLTIDESIVAKSFKIVSPAGHRVLIARTNGATIDVGSLDFIEAPGFVVYTNPVSALASDTVVNRAWGGGNADPDQAIAIEHNGGELNLVGGTWKLQQSNNGTATSVRMVDARVTYTDVLGIGTASYYLGGRTAVTTPSLAISQGAAGRTASLELADTSSVTVTGNTSADRNTSSVMFGHWNGPGTFTIKDSAAFTAPGDVLVGLTSNRQTINIEGGTFTARGIKLSANASGQNVLNFNGGVLKLGATGINTYSSGVTMQVNVGHSPELCATAATLPIVEPVYIAAGATLNLTKAEGVEAATVTMSAAVTGEGAINVGAGVTLKLVGAAMEGTLGSVEGGLTFVASAAQLVDGVITMATTQDNYDGATITVVNEAGEVVEHTAAVAHGVLTLTLSVNRFVDANTSTAEWDSGMTGYVTVKNTGDEATTLTISTIPSGVTAINVFGKVDIVFTEDAVASGVPVQLQSGAEVTASGAVKNPMTVPAGTTLTVAGETSSVDALVSVSGGEVVIDGTVTANARIVIPNGSTLTVKPGATLNLTLNEQFSAVAGNAVNGTYNIYGTLNLGSSRLNMNNAHDTCWLNLYAGSIMTGTDEAWFNMTGGWDPWIYIKAFPEAVNQFVTFDVHYGHGDYNANPKWKMEHGSGVGLKILKTTNNSETLIKDTTNVGGLELAGNVKVQMPEAERGLRGAVVIGAGTKVTLTRNDSISYDQNPKTTLDIAGILDCGAFRQTLFEDNTITLRDGGQITGAGADYNSEYTAALDVCRALTIKVAGTATIAGPVAQRNAESVITIAPVDAETKGTLVLSNPIIRSSHIDLQPGAKVQLPSTVNASKVITTARGKMIVAKPAATEGQTIYRTANKSFTFIIQ